MYERFEKLLELHNLTSYRVAKKTGIATATLSDWKNGRSVPKADKIKKIADFLEVDDKYFTDEFLHTCPLCGLSYVSDSDDDLIEHEKTHTKWEECVKKYGFCWAYAYRERKKAEGRNIVSDTNASLDEKFEAQINVFKALFSRSLSAWDYCLDHPVFEDYVAMLLNQDQFKQSLTAELYKKLVEEYGTKIGIVNGITTYGSQDTEQKDEKVCAKAPFAAYGREEADFTKGEIDKINSFIDFVRQQRNKED